MLKQTDCWFYYPNCIWRGRAALVSHDVVVLLLVITHTEKNACSCCCREFRLVLWRKVLMSNSNSRLLYRVLHHSPKKTSLFSSKLQKPDVYVFEIAYRTAKFRRRQIVTQVTNLYQSCVFDLSVCLYLRKISCNYIICSSYSNSYFLEAIDQVICNMK